MFFFSHFFKNTMVPNHAESHSINLNVLVHLFIVPSFLLVHLFIGPFILLMKFQCTFHHQIRYIIVLGYVRGLNNFLKPFWL